jgi:hypothetical protein
MDWLVFLVVLVCGVGFLGWRSQKADQATKAKFAGELKQNICRVQNQLIRGDLPNLDAQYLGYRPVAGECIYAASEGVKDNRNGLEGRLLVTNKAFVFESGSKSERFVRNSISAVEIRADGFILRKRNGPVRPFLTGPNPELLAIVQVTSWSE